MYTHRSRKNTKLQHRNIEEQPESTQKFNSVALTAARMQKEGRRAKRNVFRQVFETKKYTKKKKRQNDENSGTREKKISVGETEKIICLCK